LGKISAPIGGQAHEEGFELHVALHQTMNDSSTTNAEYDAGISVRMSLKLIRILRLKQLAASRGLVGPVALGRAIGKKANQVSDLLSGKASFGEKVARSIEEAAGLPANWLDELDGNGNTSVGPVLLGKVPILTEVQAGMYKQFVDNYLPGDSGLELISTSVPIKRHTYALRVTGDSMEPEFRDGMLLVVEPEMEHQPGDYVIAMTADSQTTFKQLIKDGPDWYLKPLNPRYPLKPLGDAQIVGVVRAVEKRFR
jgi:phage repressor protein C with HTH and peptisase S24 domain